MLKNIIILIALSLVAVFFMPTVTEGVKYLLVIHQKVSSELANVFYDGTTGNLIKEFIALLAMPFIAALIPTIVYWVVKRHWFPYFMEVLWIFWLIQIGALAMTT